jgi:hypothetical protein
MPRRTEVLVEVGALFCTDPSFGNSTRVGVSVPSAAQVISADLMVSDNDSHGWTPPGERPNITIRREDFAERDGLKFIGWWVDNRDENLHRLLHATVTWEGSGEDIAQSEVMNVHGCHKFRNSGPMASFPVPDKVTLSAGLLIPSGGTLTAEHREVRESNGAWTSSLGELRMSGFNKAAPGLPGYTWAAIGVENSHRSAARALRVRGRIS